MILIFSFDQFMNMAAEHMAFVYTEPDAKHAKQYEKYINQLVIPDGAKLESMTEHAKNCQVEQAWDKFWKELHTNIENMEKVAKEGKTYIEVRWPDMPSGKLKASYPVRDEIIAHFNQQPQFFAQDEGSYFVLYWSHDNIRAKNQSNQSLVDRIKSWFTF